MPAQGKTSTTSGIKNTGASLTRSPAVVVYTANLSTMRLLHLLATASGALAVTFTSCTAPQIATLEAAIERATNKSYAAIEHLEANPNGSEVQTTWYGEFSRERYNRVLGAFEVRRRLLGRLKTNVDTCT